MHARRRCIEVRRPAGSGTAPLSKKLLAKACRAGNVGKQDCQALPWRKASPHDGNNPDSMCMPDAEFRPDTAIGNAKAVTDAFGGWPSFHDAEILHLTLQREPRAASLECVVHVFKGTPEVDDTGHFVHAARAGELLDTTRVARARAMNNLRNIYV